LVTVLGGMGHDGFSEFTSSSYFDRVIANQSIRDFERDPTAILKGERLISMETQSEIGNADTALIYIEANFPSFLYLLQFLPSWEQDLMLCYYGVHLTQGNVSKIVIRTQTQCSVMLREAVKHLLALMIFGTEPMTPEVMTPILQAAGLNEPEIVLESQKYLAHPQTLKVDLAQLLAEYLACHSFAKIATKYHLHRPALKRAMLGACEALRANEGQREQALGWLLWGVLGKASAKQSGLTDREDSKMVDLHVTLPDVLGKFSVRIGEPEYLQVFTSVARIDVN
jgi:hypothetical protein